jgi:hypothetical protein
VLDHEMKIREIQAMLNAYRLEKARGSQAMAKTIRKVIELKLIALQNKLALMNPN